MIDNNLIHSNIKHLTQCLLDKEDIGLIWAYKLKNSFTDDLIQKIKLEFNTNIYRTKVELQEKSLRTMIPWRSDSIIEETHIIFQSCEKIVSKIFERNVKFQSINFWNDLPGYTISPHQDNDRISIAIQIYINNASLEAGTEFYKNDKIFTKLPWISNTGYILNNISESVHGMTTLSPQRQSLYAIYK